MDDQTVQMQLQTEFFVDDHRFWPAIDKQNSASRQADKAADLWNKIGRKISQEISRRGLTESEESGNIVTQITQGKSKRNYREFLKKFMVLKEELLCDEDEFDLNYYSYGLRLYKNMPLIEPLESREVMRILNFIIIIDSSFSTNGSLVRHFLEETFHILTSRDSFFHKSRIHILQCDNQVRRDMLITSLDDIEFFMKNFELAGGGGTDFRPAFSYINEQLEKGIYDKIKGVIYFTDGKGIYPAQRPAYDTAFIFIGENNNTEVPAWAMKLELTL